MGGGLSEFKHIFCASRGSHLGWPALRPFNDLSWWAGCLFSLAKKWPDLTVRPSTLRNGTYYSASLLLINRVSPDK
jgi:hypothetical protein